jgi:hypothetical protein
MTAFKRKKFSFLAWIGIHNTRRAVKKFKRGKKEKRKEKEGII